MQPQPVNKRYKRQFPVLKFSAFFSLLFLIVCLQSPLLLANELETEETAVRFTREVIDGGYGIVTCHELKDWLENNRQVLIVDTMPYEKSYALNHIPGAEHLEFPIPEMPTINPALQKELLQLLGPDKNRTIVFYCGFTACSRSHNGAKWAKMLGYQNVYRCPGGIKGWLEAGYPATTIKRR